MQKVLVIGNQDSEWVDTIKRLLQSELGQEVIILSEEEAKQSGLPPEAFIAGPEFMPLPDFRKYIEKPFRAPLSSAELRKRQRQDFKNQKKRFT